MRNFRNVLLWGMAAFLIAAQTLSAQSAGSSDSAPPGAQLPASAGSPPSATTGQAPGQEPVQPTATVTQPDGNYATGQATAQEPVPPPPANRGIINPAQAPLQPVTPGEPSAAQPASSTAVPAAPPPQPVGVAIGQEGETAGGPASRPAGMAIAPAKQRQMRSLFIKVGAGIAGAVAIGTVVALSRGTPSNPPGSKSSEFTFRH